MLKVIVACEFSGIVRDAFHNVGCDAISCDLLPTESEGPHLQCDIRDVDLSKYDLMIAHPPCTYICVSGARWFKGREKQQQEALEFVKFLLDAPVDRICLENPIGVISTKIKKPTQIVQPWMFGYCETKATCLWLKNLPPLLPTKIEEDDWPECHWTWPSKDRWKIRSRTNVGMAEAMAAQWGNLPTFETT